MKRSHLAKLFSTFGIVLIVISLNTFIASQGEHAIFDIPLISDERPAMSFFGLLMGSVLLFLMSIAGFLYARRTTGKWPARIPAVWLQGLNPNAIESKVFQAAILFLFVAVPLACFIHFINIVWISKLCVLGSSAEPVPVSSSWFGGIPGADNQIRLVANLSQEDKCAGGIQVFPGWEFSLLWLSTGISLIMTLLFLVQIVHPAQTRRRGES